MKNMFKLALATSLVMSASAFAAEDGKDAVEKKLVVGTHLEVASPLNVSQTVEIIAADNRSGFVKNDFNITVSANVGLTALDSNTIFGVAAGADRGRAVYTGTSEGGSVAQCGGLADTSKKGDAAETGAKFAKNTATLVLANANGCGRT